MIGGMHRHANPVLSVLRTFSGFLPRLT